MNDHLEQRLASLDIPVSPAVARRALAASRITPAVVSLPARAQRTRRRPRPALVAAALAPAVLIAGTLGGAYYAPAYGQALADAPAVGAISGPLLRGLGMAGDRLTAYDQVARSSGHEVRLVAGYADPFRTVVFLEVDGHLVAPVPTGQRVVASHSITHPVVTASGVASSEPGSTTRVAPFVVATLQDQFGRTYASQALIQSPSALAFAPLASPASAVGARLTLRISALVAPEGSSPPHTIRGDWTLRFTLVRATSRPLPAPAPARTGDLTYTFESVRWSPNVVELDYTIRGGNSNARDNATLIGIGGAPAIDGSAPAFADPVVMASTAGADDTLHVRQLMAVPRPGRYRLVTPTAAMRSGDDAPPAIAWIDVP